MDIKGSARTLFAVRTTGEVDLFARPGALVSYRGALALTSWDTDTAEQHRFLLQVPRMKRLRINFRLPEGPFPHGYPIQVEVRGPDGLEFQQRWVGLTRSRHYEYEFWRLEYLELTGDNLEGLWTVSMNHVAGGYRMSGAPAPRPLDRPGGHGSVAGRRYAVSRDSPSTLPDPA